MREKISVFFFLYFLACVWGSSGAVLVREGQWNNLEGTSNRPRPPPNFGSSWDGLEPFNDNTQPPQKSLPELLDATVDELSRGMAEGAFTSVHLVKAYIRRIEESHERNHAVIQINPDALEIAKSLDVERKAGKVRGPIHGIPILIKDNIGTGDKMDTCAGSTILRGAKLPRDSTVVRKLREAGAVILGKANLSEWAYWRTSNTMTSGWTPNGGQVLGAYHENQDPDGSSSGSGVAASLGLAAITLGSETDGSLLSPAGHNNCVTIKPTPGLTSRYLCIPINPRKDTIGPICRTVKDAAVTLAAIAGADPNDEDPDCKDNPRGDNPPDYAAACKPDALRGARIGIPRDVIDFRLGDVDYRFRQDFLTLLNEVVPVLEAAGAVVVDTSFADMKRIFNATDKELWMDGVMFNDGLPKYLEKLTVNPMGVRTVADVRALTQSLPEEEYPKRDTECWDRVLGVTSQHPEFQSRADELDYLGNDGGLIGALDRDGLDAIILPTTDNAPIFASLARAPAVSVPMGSYDEDTEVIRHPDGIVARGPNLPYGVTFMGRRWSEEKLIGYAYAYEQRTMVRKKVHPIYTPTVELKDVISGEPLG